MNDENWNQTISSLSGAHLLQTLEWAEVKKEVGWSSTQMVWRDDQVKVSAAANLLTRSMKLLGIGPKISICYIPRGPILDWNNQALRKMVLDEIQKKAREIGAVFLKIDAEVPLIQGIPGSDDSVESPTGKAYVDDLAQRGWKYSSEQIQFKNTVLLNLEGSEDDWLKRMKQKARYNLRLSQRSGVVVRSAKPEELVDLYKMYAQTASRDGFIIREMDYYLGVWNRFINAGIADALVAEVEGEKIAGLVLFHFGKRAWYLYGMSTNLHREKMPNYLLQWEAMRMAKEKGCEVYDLWGAPDVFDSSDSMFGVFRFKDGIGGEVLCTPGAWDYVIKPGLYFIYMRILPRILDFTRWIRRGKIQQETK